MFVSSDMIEVPGVSILEWRPDPEEESESSKDESSQLLTGYLGERCFSLILTSYACAYIPLAKKSVILFIAAE